MRQSTTPWPETSDELIHLQVTLAQDAEATAPWALSGTPVIGGCFAAFARGQSGSRQASGIDDQAVVAGRVSAPYEPGLLALRQGPILAAAVAALGLVPDVLLVDATGLDHPRRAGLALHLGAVLGMPTVGVTHRPLLAHGDLPLPVRGSVSPLYLEGRIVACWVCTRSRSRPVVAHAGWRTDADAARAVVLLASTEAARTPVPLEEARRVARETRSSKRPDPRMGRTVPVE